MAGNTATGTAVAAANPAMKNRLLTSTDALRLNPFDAVYTPRRGRAASDEIRSSVDWTCP